MSIEETRMDLAVDLVGRAFRASPELGAGERLAAFREAHAALTRLDAGQDDWTEDLLAAAWELVAGAWPRGGPLAELVADLGLVFRGLVETVPLPPEARRRKPRRDA